MAKSLTQLFNGSKIIDLDSHEKVLIKSIKEVRTDEFQVSAVLDAKRDKRNTAEVAVPIFVIKTRRGLFDALKSADASLSAQQKAFLNQTD